MHRNNLQAFLENLPAKGAKIDLQDLWIAFSKAFPSYHGEGRQSRKVLNDLLNYLAEDGFRLPANKKKDYDHLGSPSLPKWIMRPVKEKKSPAFDPSAYIWSPELSFLASKSSLQAADRWLKLDQWFKANRNCTLPLIPMRERSYEIFRDEKALDSFRNAVAFKEGDISLETLRCFIVYAPMPTEFGPDGTEGKPALLVENHTTHWTVAEWNKQVGRYRCVVYGGGNKASAAWKWLEWKKAEYQFSEILYFGDIDVAGLDIALSARESIENFGNVSFSLDEDLYRLALGLAKGEGGVQTKNGKTAYKDATFAMLPDDLAQEIRKLFERARRIPQEIVTRQTLDSLVQ